ncbi:MAG: hypothetical protein HUJ79_03670, partial [Firmicutes bacterium]|nr:hypothetical protein [Bacillota bacterium]
VVSMSAENIERISRQAAVLELEDINRGILELSQTMNDARWSTQPRILLELAIVKLCLGAGEIRELSEYEFAKAPAAPAAKPQPAAKKAAPKPAPVEEPAAPVVAEAEPAEPAPVEPEPVVEDFAEAPALEAATEAPAPAESEFDCEAIWNDVFEDGEAEMGSFYIIRSGGTLTSIDEDDFTIVVGNALTKMHAENNRQLLEDLMEKHTGKRRVMRISQKDLKKKEKSVEEIASNASDLLGIKVDIK